MGQAIGYPGAERAIHLAGVGEAAYIAGVGQEDSSERAQALIRARQTASTAVKKSNDSLNCITLLCCPMCALQCFLGYCKHWLNDTFEGKTLYSNIVPDDLPSAAQRMAR